MGRDLRRRLDQFRAHPNCPASVLAAIHGVSLAELARAEEPERPARREASPFALERGRRFERWLLEPVIASEQKRRRECFRQAVIDVTDEDPETDRS